MLPLWTIKANGICTLYGWTLALCLLASRHRDLEPRSRKFYFSSGHDFDFFARRMITVDLINFSFLSRFLSFPFPYFSRVSNGIRFWSFDFNNPMKLKRTFIESKLTSSYLSNGQCMKSNSIFYRPKCKSKKEKTDKKWKQHYDSIWWVKRVVSSVSMSTHLKLYGFIYMRCVCVSISSKQKLKAIYAQSKWNKFGCWWRSKKYTHSSSSTAIVIKYWVQVDKSEGICPLFLSGYRVSKCQNAEQKSSHKF